METIGKIRVEVVVSEVCKEVTFIIVEKLIPDLIGGVEFQNTFGYHLQKKCKTEINNHQERFVCNIEAKFGRQIPTGERLRHAMEILDIKKDHILTAIIQKNEDVFMADKWDIGCTHLMKHRIITKGGPINIKPYRQPMNLEEKIEKAIKNLYDNGIIRKCNSQWNTPLICVWKKEKKDIRLCLDFRQLNAITERQAFPMPNVDEMLDALEGTQYFSSIDLGNAYYQMELSEDSQEKTAFSTKQGQFCFNRMPFGIATAPGTFQEMMNKVIGKIKGAMVYLDDILIFTETKEQHYEIINTVLTEIKKAGLRVNPEKCQFMRKEIKF
ncbi:MAG: reverse transcriptase family protein, partial [Bacteroidales bacterium]